MPWLAALVCCSAFDLALHDAYGVLHGVPTYETYNAEYMNADLAPYLTPAEGSDVSFAGKYPDDFLVFPRPESIPAWHLVGGKDPLDASELTGDRARRRLSRPAPRLDPPRRPEVPQGQAPRRRFDAARIAERPELEAFAMFAQAPSVARAGGRQRAVRMLDRVLGDAQQLTVIRDGDTLGAEMFGLLHLMGAHFAVRNSDAAAAGDHLDEAARVAVLTGERNGLLQHFGPTNVNVWRVAVSAELGRGPTAAERVEREPIDLDILGSKDRIAALHFDLARSWAQAEGDRDTEAIRHLDTADRIAPQRLRNDPMARDLCCHVGPAGQAPGVGAGQPA